MTEREKLIELLECVGATCDVPCKVDEDGCGTYEIMGSDYIADHLIANGVTIQKWIPVSEPPDLFTGVNAYCPARKNIYTLYLNNRGEWHFFDKTVAGALVDEPVTHWMPLPEAPKEGEDNA